MFRLHRTNRHAKSGERIDFKFSHFKVLQVPKGWNKLILSIIAEETGKVISKSSKALVRNGTCQWTETLSESIWVSQEESSPDCEDHLFRIVVSMGSARSGILGETTLNMTGYMSSSAVVPVSIPLKKCNHGTIFQVKIHCLTPRRKREDESIDPNSHKKDQNAKSSDICIELDESDSTLTRSVDLSSSKELVPASQKEPESSGTSFSPSDSKRSYASAEGSIEGGKLSLGNNLSDDNKDESNGKPQSTNSQNNVPQGRYPVVKASESDNSSHNSENIGSSNSSVNNHQELAAATFGISTSKSLMEAAETTIEELRVESKMWERNSKKLMVDFDALKKEVSDLSKIQANLETELSATCIERDGLRDELEQLRLLLEKSMVKTTTDESIFQANGVTRLQNELEDEIKFQKESNTNLALQLKRSQESNVELIMVLQELEETIEKQKLEIENLSTSKFSHVENSIPVNTEENKNLVLQLQQLQETEKNLQAKVRLLEQAVEEKNQNKEKQSSVNNQSLLDIQTEYKAMLSAKDNEIVNLKAKLSESHNVRYSAEMEYTYRGDDDLRREIEDLKEKLEELERDCNELTDENLDLLFKLKEIKSNSTGERASLVLSSSELLENSSSRSEVSDPESEGHSLEEKLKKKVSREIENHYDVQIQQLETIKDELEVKVKGLTEELSQKTSEIERLEAKLLSKEEENKYLHYSQTELQAKFVSLQEENIQLRGNMTIVSRESDITTKCLNDLQKDILVLSSSVDSNVSAKRTLEKKSSELENERRELELYLSELEHENSQLSACISDLEAQLRSVMDERDSRELELENSNSLAMNLQDQITRLRNQMEIQEKDLKQKLEEMHNQWLEAEEECEYLRREQSSLQATVKRLAGERSSMEKSNEDLKKHKFELQEQCSNLETKLRKSNDSLASFSKKNSDLEENLSWLVEDIALKERSLNSQLDALLDENGMQREKLVQAESLLERKTVEIENLQQEKGNLTEQLCATRDERERVASEAKHEVSILLADKATLECALEELQSKVSRTQSELSSIRIESETKVQGLMDELAASKGNQEMLIFNHEKVLKQLEICRSNEEKFKISLNDLELKLTVSDYERQQLMEESTDVKVQLLRMEHLQDKILSLKNEVVATKSEKEKLKTSFDNISGEYQDLKVQNLSFLEKISTLQKAVSELEDCKHSKALTEEKLLEMENDLMAKQALCAQSIEIKNELSMIKRDNSQFQWKIQQLEEEKDRCLLRAQALEEELNLKKEEKQNQREISSINSRSSQHQKEGNNGQERRPGSSAAARVDNVSRIKLLEAELSKMREANKKYKLQLDRLLSESRNSNAKARKSKGEGEVVTKEKFERTKSSLETELTDIRERYLQMSLKYAEVEAQREELVMKLKMAKNGTGLFS